MNDLYRQSQSLMLLPFLAASVASS